MRVFECPYCFERVQEDQVLFRSDKVTFPHHMEWLSGGESARSAYERPDNKEQEIAREIRQLELEDKGLLKAKKQVSWSNYQFIVPDSEEKDEALARHEAIQARIRELQQQALEPPPNASAASANADETDASFFDIVEHDELYERFWRKFHGTSENNPGDTVLNGKSYKRKLIDPKNPAHQKYLRKQRDSGKNAASDYFILDGDGMIKMVELNDPEYRYCNVRVCPHCHNPLPENFGKNMVKNIVVIGVRGSGKTVYLSRLLYDMRNYALKVGLTAHVNGSSIREFGERNPVRFGAPLPESTLPHEFQQPLVYDMTRDDGKHNRITETLVMYDVAGEVFDKKELLDHFASYIKRADGIILLIDPSQLDNVWKSIKKANQKPGEPAKEETQKPGEPAKEETQKPGEPAKEETQKPGEPTKVLQSCYSLITENQSGRKKCPIPVAVCLSKMDEIQDLIQKTDGVLLKLLMEDVRSQSDAHGYPKPLFNASQYNPILEKLLTFFKKQDMSLAHMMHTDFSNYAYFAFSALGCAVEVKTDTIQTTEGEKKVNRSYPAAVVIPKRIEEPMLWLFYQLGYIGVNEPIDNPDDHTPCPNCRSFHTEILPEDEREFITKTGLFRKLKEYHNLYCNDCGHHWFDAKAEEEAHTGGE